jgi:hypothetical protein
MEISLSLTEVKFINFKIITVTPNDNKRFGVMNIDTSCQEKYPLFILTFRQ